MRKSPITELGARVQTSMLDSSFSAKLLQNATASYRARYGNRLRFAKILFALKRLTFHACESDILPP